MDVTPKTLREVEFREKIRGYHPEDVDHFLEEVAAGLDVLQERMRQAVERAQRAEAAASEAGDNDEALRKTLVLAQRTADMAVQEAREQAARILAGAEQQAQGILADAEERGRRTMEEATADTKTQLARLETSRAQAQQDVDVLNRWLDEHKTHLLESLREATAAVEHAGVMWPPPSTRPIDLPGLPPLPRHSPSVAPALEPDLIGSDTVMWDPAEDQRFEAAPGAGPGAPPPPPAAPAEEAAPVVSEAADNPDDRALDDFFEESDELGEDRRFGGRLRRRR